MVTSLMPFSAWASLAIFLASRFLSLLTRLVLSQAATARSDARRLVKAGSPWGALTSRARRYTWLRLREERRCPRRAADRVASVIRARTR